MRRFQPKNAPKAFGGRGPRPAPQCSPDLLPGFKIGGRDKGRRKGVKTERDRQLREGDRGRKGGAEGEKGWKKVEGEWMEAEISQGHPKAQNASQKSLGDKV